MGIEFTIEPHVAPRMEMSLDLDGASFVDPWEVKIGSPSVGSDIDRLGNIFDVYFNARDIGIRTDGYPNPLMLPRVGDPSFKHSNSFICTTVSGSPWQESNVRYRFFFRYQNVKDVSVRLYGATSREPWSLDATGNLLRVSMTDKNANPNNLDQFAEAEVFRPGAVLEFTRLEYCPNWSDALLRGGYVNKTTWQGRPAFQWMLESITTSRTFFLQGISGALGNPGWWPVKYAFRFRGWSTGSSPTDATATPMDWRYPAIWRHPLTGRGTAIDIGTDLRAGLSSGNGWRLYGTQPELDFNTFGLPDMSSVLASPRLVP